MTSEETISRKKSGGANYGCKKKKEKVEQIDEKVQQGTVLETTNINTQDWL